MQTGIYQIVNVVNGKKYIGSSVNFKARKREHWRTLRLNQHHCSHLQNAWNKYGEENFRFFVVEISDSDSLLALEQDYLDCCENLYNSSSYAVAGSSGQKPITKKMCEQIIDMFLTGYFFATDIAKKFGIDKTTTKRILRGESHCFRGICKEKIKKCKEILRKNAKVVNVGRAPGNRALSEEDVKKIRWLYEYRNSQPIGKYFGVSDSTVKAIGSGQNYSSIKGKIECPEILLDIPHVGDRKDVTFEKVICVMQDYISNPRPFRELGADHGISRQVATLITKGKRFPDKIPPELLEKCLKVRGLNNV